MRIIQISDIHIPHEVEKTHDIPVRENFSRILTSIASLQYDALVFTGDLAYKEGDAAIYQYIKQELSSISKPIFYIPGNHDSPELFAQFFLENASSSILYYKKTVQNKTFLFLDTSQNYIDAAQIAWLKTELMAMQDVVIFMHHPPCYCGVEYMDTHHALQNQEEILSVLYAHQHTISVFCGHYHHAKEIISKNVHVHICPSTYYQINPVGLQFAIGSKEIGFRLISFSSTIKTEVIWI
ncbi:MAG: metallophosphoesterase [Bacteroidales bacterium]|nr:metallophosphoesterase [Bacteroidales bacterium]NLK80572.1 hypothetical protein [Bacteroidales bacterium]